MALNSVARLTIGRHGLRAHQRDLGGLDLARHSACTRCLRSIAVFTVPASAKLTRCSSVSAAFPLRARGGTGCDRSGGSLRTLGVRRVEQEQVGERRRRRREAGAGGIMERGIGHGASRGRRCQSVILGTAIETARRRELLPSTAPLNQESPAAFAGPRARPQP